MGATILTIGRKANKDGANLGNGYAVLVSVSVLLANRLRGIAPRKTWAYLVHVLGLGERAAKHRLAISTDGLTVSRDFTVDELAVLLRSEHGFQFLVDVMADAKPAWWKLCRPLMEAADAQRLQMAARKKIQQALEGALNADNDLTATIDRGQTALALRTTDCSGARLAPHGGPHGHRVAGYGLLPRPVAAAVKQKA